MSKPRIINILGEDEYFLPGHSACHGCGAAIGLRHLLKALGKNSVIVVPAGCTSIIAGSINASAFGIPLVHAAFGGAPSIASGISDALDKLGRSDINVVVWAGDGGTYDIGLASLSGAAERGHNILYVLDDNEAYMNTGIQRSGGTPKGAWTTTTVKGKEEEKKDILSIVMAHKIPYAATASVAYPMDYVNKIKKALRIKGFKFIHLMSPCPPGWRFDPRYTVEIARRAVLSGVWILMEIEDGLLKLNPPSNTMLDERRIPIRDYVDMQGRFRVMDEETYEEFTRDVEERWRMIKAILRMQEEGLRFF